MGHYTSIYGYIESHKKYIDRNQAAIANFQFDEVFPFANGFGQFNGSTRGSFLISSYATIVKNDDEETWLEWILRFEELLGEMDGYLAKARFESDMLGIVYVRDYFVFGDSKKISEIWIREPSSQPAVAGAIDFMDDEEASSEETS